MNCQLSYSITIAYYLIRSLVESEQMKIHSSVFIEASQFQSKKMKFIAVLHVRPREMCTHSYDKHEKFRRLALFSVQLVVLICGHGIHQCRLRCVNIVVFVIFSNELHCRLKEKVINRNCVDFCGIHSDELDD